MMFSDRKMDFNTSEILYRAEQLRAEAFRRMLISIWQGANRIATRLARFSAKFTLRHRSA